jgi:hypothetical protein
MASNICEQSVDGSRVPQLKTHPTRARSQTTTSACSSHCSKSSSSSDSYHMLPIIAEADGGDMSLNTTLSSTRFAYLRPYYYSSSASSSYEHGRAHPAPEDANVRSSRSSLQSSRSTSDYTVSVSSTAGREFHLDLGLLTRAYAEVVGTNALPPDSPHADLNVPTHTGADPPEDAVQGLGDSGSAQNHAEEDLRRKLRTGRGGLGSPGNMILRRMRYIGV